MTYDWEADAKGGYDLAIAAKREAWLVENIPGVKQARVIGGQTLLQGDCLEIMPGLERFDAVVTDPPYGIGADEAQNAAAEQRKKASGKSKAGRGWKEYRQTAWDRDRPDRVIFEQFLKMSKDQVIWGGNYFSDFLPPRMRWLIWDKGQRDFSLADFEMAWTSQDKAARAFDYPRAKALADVKQHPTQKPVALMEWCLGFLPDAKTILDPFMGSGTTLVACQRLGRFGTGIELDADYFAIACKRVEEAARQPDLFVEPAKPAPVQEGFDL